MYPRSLDRLALVGSRGGESAHSWRNGTVLDLSLSHLLLPLLLPTVALLGLLLAWPADSVLAQDTPTVPAVAAEPAPAADAPAAEVENSGDDTEKSIREQDIYIPYEKLRQVFEKHGRGVFLPYEKFQELWQAAQDKTRPAAEPKPPVGALITEIENEATVEKDVVRVKAEAEDRGAGRRLERDSAAAGRRGHHRAPRSDGKPARIVGEPGQDYRC